MLSQSERRVRKLGMTETYEVPCGQLVMFTGNNISIGADLTRRVARTRMVPTEGSEILTREFKRPRLLAEAIERRAELLNDLYTIVAYEGQPDDPMPVLAGYGMWCEMVARPLVALGMEDPVEVIVSAKSMDPERSDLEEVLLAWERVLGNGPVKVKQVLKPHDNLLATWMKELHPVLQMVAGSPNGGVNAWRLGRWLSANVDRVTSTKRVLRRVSAPGVSEQKWRVERLEGAPGPERDLVM